MKSFLTKSAKETQKAGFILAKEISSFSLLKRATVICLNGDLGGGKTTFLQGFAKGLGIKEKILSPTFVILKRFNLKGEHNNFYHLDCYRIQNPKEASFLKLKEILKDSRNIVAIEWAQNIKSLLPKNSISLEFVFLKENERKIIIKYV